MDHEWPQIARIIADSWRGFNALGVCRGTPVTGTLGLFALSASRQGRQAGRRARQMGLPG